jgi:hypothetical protein
VSEAARLPNVERAIVDVGKISGYLLDASHPDGGPKAAFFLRAGFKLSEPERLAAALRTHALTAAVTATSTTAHGVKFILRGKLATPSGRTPVVQSVWIVDVGQDVPRLVTAYPVQERT